MIQVQWTDNLSILRIQSPRNVCVLLAIVQVKIYPELCKLSIRQHFVNYIDIFIFGEGAGDKTMCKGTPERNVMVNVLILRAKDSAPSNTGLDLQMAVWARKKYNPVQSDCKESQVK